MARRYQVCSQSVTASGLVGLPDQGLDWGVHYALFARAGFTEAAQAEAEQHRVELVDLERLDQALKIVGPRER